MYIVLFLVLIGKAFGFLNLPMNSDAVGEIASKVKDIKNYFTSYHLFGQPEIIEESKSYWTILKEYAGYETTVPEESISEPIIICNGFIVLAFFFVPCFYILAIKKYFLTQTAKPEFVAFMDNEDADEVESEYQSSMIFNNSCPHCSHKAFVDERGDL